MKLTFYGLREWLGSLIIALILIGLIIFAAVAKWISSDSSVVLISFVLFLWSALAAFFRDPHRKITSSDVAIVSPADGVVRDIELINVDLCESEDLKRLFAGRDMLRIGVFLSVFDVHLNRAPAPLKVEFKFYKIGSFHDARDPRAGKENESMLIGGTATAGGLSFPLAVKQISGAIARRIVCPVEPGMIFQRGQRYGMIKFGSRTELYLPAGKGFNVKVKVGDRVTGGSTIIADIIPEIAKESKTIVAASEEASSVDLSPKQEDLHIK